MRRALGWMVATVVVGCAKPAAVFGPPVLSHPDLVCPTGAFLTGAVPPQGNEAWCARLLPSGATVREGPSVRWHANGTHRAEGAYVEDEPTGPWLYWYPNDVPRMAGSFQGGVRAGVWRTFHAGGEPASQGAYVDGKEHGPWVFWSIDPPVRAEGEYVLGDREGVWRDIGRDEAVFRERRYRGGRMISVRELDQ